VITQLATAKGPKAHDQPAHAEKICYHGSGKCEEGLRDFPVQQLCFAAPILVVKKTLHFKLLLFSIKRRIVRNPG
jgi:hypothetical protein